MLKCKGGWAVAEVEARPRQREIRVSLSKTYPRARHLASPAAKTPCLPETCYAALQATKLDSRRTVLGRKERWKLVQLAYPGLPVPTPPKGMSEADVLDVLILAWAAQETAAGRAPGRFTLMP